MTGGLPPAPRWAWIVMALGVVSIVVLTYLTLNRPPPPRFTAPSSAGAAERTTAAPTGTAGTTTPTSATPAGDEAAPPEPIRMLVVGEGFTTADAATGQGWPQLLRDDLAAAGQPVDLTVATADLAGYAEPDPGGTTFPVLAQGAGAGFDLIVFFGSRYDIAAAADVRAAAEAAFSLARAASPDAGLVVIGPAWAGTPPGYVVTNRDALAAAAGPAGAVFVDPLAGGWFTGPAAQLTSPDGIHVTAEGHRYLADLIRPVVEGFLV